MKRRLVRARRKVTDARIPFRVPPDDQLPQRLAGVLRVIYLVYTEGHGGLRGDLCDEAIRLARLLARLMPDEAETLGLLALLLLTDARRGGRIGEDGGLISLEDQDRSLWDAARIAEGVAALERALCLGRSGPHVVQAAIAALHSQVPSWEEIDWPQIAGLYAELERLDPSPVVTINRAVAVAFAEGAQTGLAILDELQVDPRLERYQPQHAARAYHGCAAALTGCDGRGPALTRAA